MKKKNKHKEYIKSQKRKRRNWKTITMICSKCKKKRSITTTEPDLYTDKIRKKFVCVFCRYK